MKQRKAIVRIDGQPVGKLFEDGSQVVFQYDEEWVADPQSVAISLAMPLRTEPFITNGLHPFFENLLSEGWLLELATTSLKISKDDAFGLLVATCADCIGAVEILPADESL